MSDTIDSRTTVAVIGAGSMGAGIAQLAAKAGHAVQLFDAQSAAAGKALERIAADLDLAIKRGKLEPDERDAVLQRITAVDRLEAMAGCGLAVEAIVERLETKQALFHGLESVLMPSAVLATNTSSLSITAVAQGLKHPERVIGWHFFNPPTRMRLVEIIPGVETGHGVVRTMQKLSVAWGKISVDAPNVPGFIVNRVARPYYAEAMRLRAEGAADVPTLDKLLREAGGFTMGPFELMDLIGLDVNLSVTEAVFQATGYDTRYAPNLIQQELVRSGRFGRKSGRGFYGHGPGAAPVAVSPVMPSHALPALRHAADTGLLAPLVERLRRAGVTVEVDTTLPAQSLAFDSVRIALTDGRTAAEVAATGGNGGVLLLDLARDYSSTGLVAAAASAGAEGQLPTLAALLAPASIALIALADVAGLTVMRTVCCLANEAADLMTWSGTKATDIDTAMRLGTAYPIGPLAWADAIGPSRVFTVLANLQGHYGDLRYRRAPQLSRVHFSNGRFHA